MLSETNQDNKYRAPEPQNFSLQPLSKVGSGKSIGIDEGLCRADRSLVEATFEKIKESGL